MSEGQGAPGDMIEFELIAAETRWRGQLFTAGVERFRYPDGDEVSREKV